MNVFDYYKYISNTGEGHFYIWKSICHRKDQDISESRYVSNQLITQTLNSSGNKLQSLNTPKVHSTVFLINKTVFSILHVR